MTRLSIAKELESAADRIADIPQANLPSILRRAALMLRNVPGMSLHARVEDALNSLAAEMRIGQTDLIKIILRDWLETNSYIPVGQLEDDNETDGIA
ncbi:hypothetical protein [Mesorhizobium sp.]|jgi:hypothetical protein|uniref:hypothetical protein n=1 Tax=Mesorhizobium sp. TaxID=1871066 RepID=UPI0035670030